MSDGLNDVARDEKRIKCFYGYLEAIITYLKNPTFQSLNDVVKAARITDSVRGGYWGAAPTDLEACAKERVQKLREYDKEEWTKILAEALNTRMFRSLKSLSPFSDQILVHVDYGVGFVRLEGEVEALIASIIEIKKGWRTYDCDDYVVILPKPDIKDAEVFWLRCGIDGVYGPRAVI